MTKRLVWSLSQLSRIFKMPGFARSLRLERNHHHGLKQRSDKERAKKNYRTIESIFDDIIDLAGVRVALYFPAEREQVGKLVRQLFLLKGEPKEFPESSSQHTPNDFPAIGLPIIVFTFENRFSMKHKNVTAMLLSRFKLHRCSCMLGQK
jgi:hypothetical protein